MSLLLRFVLTVQHTQHKHPCSRRESNSQSQQASGSKPRLTPLDYWHQQSPDRPACSELLYRLSYSCPNAYVKTDLNCVPGHFTTEPHINEGTVTHRRIMRGTLYWSHLYVLWRKGSPYAQRYRNLVSRIREAGLPLYWEADVIRHYMSERLQLQISTSRMLNQNTGPTRLNLNQLQGVFFLLVLGEALAVIAFVSEVTFGRKRNFLRPQHV